MISLSENLVGVRLLLFRPDLAAAKSFELWMYYLKTDSKRESFDFPMY
jgi:hypothetical protein